MVLSSCQYGKTASPVFIMNGRMSSSSRVISRQRAVTPLHHHKVPYGWLMVPTSFLPARHDGVSGVHYEWARVPLFASSLAARHDAPPSPENPVRMVDGPSSPPLASLAEHPPASRYFMLYIFGRSCLLFVFSGPSCLLMLSHTMHYCHWVYLPIFMISPYVAYVYSRRYPPFHLLTLTSTVPGWSSTSHRSHPRPWLASSPPPPGGCRCRESADRPPPPSAPLAGSLVIIIAANRTKHATRGRTPHQHATSCAHCLYIRPRRGHATTQRHHHSHREVVRHPFSPVRQHSDIITRTARSFVTPSRQYGNTASSEVSAT